MCSRNQRHHRNSLQYGERRARLKSYLVDFKTKGLSFGIFSRQLLQIGTPRDILLSEAMVVKLGKEDARNEKMKRPQPSRLDTSTHCMTHAALILIGRRRADTMRRGLQMALVTAQCQIHQRNTYRLPSSIL